MTDKTRSMADIVAKYLRKDPDFFVRHPEILDEANLPHETGDAASLIERQVQRLRDQNRALTRKLNQLVHVAKENEALMTRLHRLTLELMVIDDIGPFFDHLSTALLNEFKADILNISLFDFEASVAADTPLYSLRRDDPELQQFQEQLDRGGTVCGRLNRKKLEFLFGDRGQWVQSTALVPLGQDGLLAIGSSDPAYFYPGMGTLFLDLLATVVTSRLALEAPRKQRRSA